MLEARARRALGALAHAGFVGVLPYFASGARGIRVGGVVLVFALGAEHARRCWVWRGLAEAACAAVVRALLRGGKARGAGFATLVCSSGLDPSYYHHFWPVEEPSQTQLACDRGSLAQVLVLACGAFSAIAVRRLELKSWWTKFTIVRSGGERLDFALRAGFTSII